MSKLASRSWQMFFSVSNAHFYCSPLMFNVVNNVFRYSQFFIRKLERRFDLYFYQGIPRYVSSVELDVKFTIGKSLVFVFVLLVIRLYCSS